MKHHHQLFIMVASLRRLSGKISVHHWTWQVVEGAMLGNTGRSRMISNKLSCTYLISLIVWTRGKSPLKNQRILLEDQVSGGLPFWISVPNVQKDKNARFAISDISKHDFSNFFNKFKNSPYICYKIKQVHNEPTEAYFSLINILRS